MLVSAWFIYVHSHCSEKAQLFKTFTLHLITLFKMINKWQNEWKNWWVNG